MSNKVLIWDLPVRIFHWTLVLVILGAWASVELSDELIDIHMQLGYTALGLVLFRIIWGVIGTRYARFSQFFPTPKSVKSYVESQKGDNPMHSSGHNPLGAMMVFLLLALVLLQAVTGLFVDDEVFTTGPYFNAAGEWVDEWANVIHHSLFDFLLGAIGLHVAAVLFYKLYKKQDLVTPMVTGKKKADKLEQGAGITSSKFLLGLVVAALVAAFVYWLVAVAPPVSEDVYF